MVTDAVSLSLIKGSKIDFEEDLIRSAFHVSKLQVLFDCLLICISEGRGCDDI